MSKAWILFRANARNVFKLNLYSKSAPRKERVKNILLLGLILYAIAVFGFTAGINYQMMAEPLMMMDAMILIPTLAFVSCVLATLAMTLFRANGFLFSPKDFEMLSSMPVKSSDILISKMMMLLLTNYLFVVVMFVPGLFVYAIHMPTSAFFWVSGAIALVFIPLIPLVIGSLLSYLMTRFSLRFRRNNAALIVFLFLTMLVVMGFSFAYNEVLGFFVERSADLMESLPFIYYPAHLYASAVINNDVWALFAFVGVSLVVFAGFVVVLQKGFQTINAKLRESTQTSNFVMTSLETSSAFTSLFKKDLKRYFSSPIYVMNTSFGVFMMVVLAIASLIYGKQALDMLTGEGAVLLPLFELLIAMQVGFVALSCTTSPSISLEGKYFWIVRSMPVDPKTIYKSKITLNLIVVIPAVVISAVFLSIAFSLSGWEVFGLIVLPVLYACAIAVGGLLINILKPSFQWESETVAVKQTMSVLFAMLFGMALLLIPILIRTTFEELPLETLLLGTGLFVSLLTFVMYRWIMTRGVDAYYKFRI